MTNQIQNLFESIKIRWLLFKRGLDRFVARRLGLFLRPAYNAAPKNQSRRNLLKLAGLGLGAIVVGKIVGDKIFSPSLVEQKPVNPSIQAAKNKGGNYWQQTFLFSD